MRVFLPFVFFFSSLFYSITPLAKNVATTRVKTPVFISNIIPSAQIVGEAKLRYLLWNVSDISLYAPEGKWLKTQPYALTLTYLRNFKGVDIAKQSVKEMKKQGMSNISRLNKWRENMESIFPNVQKQQQLTGLVNAKGVTLFYLGNEPIGQINDPQFGQSFFAIWLGEKTSKPKVRKQLIGENK